MAGLFLVHARDGDFADAALAAARAQFAAHGFPPSSEAAVPGWRLLHAPPACGGPDGLLVDGDDLVAVAGTLIYDGKIGRPALAALLASIDLPSPDWSRIGGHFVALVRRGGRSFVLTDYFANFQLFHDAAPLLFSTSLLAATAALPRLTFDSQGVYELAFNVMPVGDDTIFSELKTLGPRRVVELTEQGARFHEIAKPLPESASASPFAELIASSRANLSGWARTVASGFGDNVACPLSGGLDSRLLLAALRAEGCRPRVFVYGGPQDGDVIVAKAIAADRGFDIEWVDKEAWRDVPPDAFAEQVERNFQAYDALPNFGELFENGANAWARAGRHRGGSLSVSGAGGEIFRNFFYLPDRPLSARTVARSFYARYAKGDLTDAFDERSFLRAIEDKILAALGREGERGRLPRPLIEQIYPRVRCRAASGREISLEAHCGAYLLPFLDQHVVAGAMGVPLRFKHAGRFEAALLAAIDPELARLPSVYGHDFAAPPDRRHLFSEWTTRIRPAALRQRSYALRRRLGPVADEHGGLLTPDYMGRVVDLEFPIMRRYFRPERINDSGLMRRIANLEYLAARLGSKLAP